MTELEFLYSFLGLAVVLAPLMTNRFFLKDSKAYSVAHRISLLVLLTAALLNQPSLVFIWPLFCAFGFFLHLKNEQRMIFSAVGIAGCIPFVFSLISSVWLVAGANDLRLLGYDPAWSYYAALHGSYLGWILTGCLAFLSRRDRSDRVDLWGCYSCFVLFLLVAFGIDGVPWIKRIGVVGLSALLPFLIGRYAFTRGRGNRRSVFLARLSLCSIVFSMALAILNEFWAAAPRVAFGVPVMVFTHGLVNALFTIPSFLLALFLEE
jgi:hypothetical protein